MATAPMNVTLDFGSVGTVTGLTSPASATDATTKAYVDSLVEGLAWKDSARVATQGNIDLASPGATIDGISMTNGDRVLVKAQTSVPSNGIYIFNGAAVPMTRSLDASTSAELEQAVITVEEGSDAGATYRQTQVNFTLDSGNIVWASFGAAVGAASETVAGKIEIATQAETDAGSDDARAVTPAKLAAYSGRMKGYVATFGDGAATSYTITHNLGTEDVIVQIWETGGNKRMLFGYEARIASTNAVTLLFNSAPSLNSLRVRVLKVVA